MTGLGEGTRRDEAGAQTRMLPGDVRRSGDVRGECGGGDWLANPTSPVDREQMGPDSLHTNHCQGGFGLLP
ncbi:hypothetical protein NQZ68_013675 [Dissostichus eleginoides]|nr:hypothetical protein NQZ68_013675 [Dissostichus eleginoides]